MPNDDPDWATTITYGTTQLINTTTGPGAFFGQYDTSKYASISIGASNSLTGYVIQLLWLDSLGALIGSESFSSPNGDPQEIMLPVVGAQVQVNISATWSGTAFFIDGSNRPVAAALSVSNTWTPRFFTLAGALGAGGQFPMVVGDGGLNTTTLNGICTFSVLAGAATGNVIAQYRVPSGGLVNWVLLQNPVINVWTTIQFTHPKTPLLWFFTPSTSPAAAGIRYVISGQ